jgi:rubrerythrin
MPEFAHPFLGKALDRKLIHEELIRAGRYAVAAELEAIQLYMQLAEDEFGKPFSKRIDRPRSLQRMS